MNRSDTLKWLDRLHILTTFAVDLKKVEAEHHCSLGTSKDVAVAALINTLDLAAFGHTEATNAFNDAYKNGQPYKAARDAFGWEGPRL